MHLNNTVIYIYEIFEDSESAIRFQKKLRGSVYRDNSRPKIGPAGLDFNNCGR